MLYETIGEYIKEKRTALHMTLDRLSNKSYAHVQTIINIESGKQIPKLETIEFILDVLGYKLIIVKKDLNIDSKERYTLSEMYEPVKKMIDEERDRVFAEIAEALYK